MFQESFPLTDKTCFLYGNPQPSHLLIQPVGAQDLSGGLEKEVACLKKMAGEDFLLAAFDIRAETPLLSFLRASGNSGRLFPGGTFFPLGRLPDRCFLRHCRCLSLCLVSGLDGVCPFPSYKNQPHLSQPRRQRRTYKESDHENRRRQYP